MLKFWLGIILLQAVAAGLCYAVLDTGLEDTRFLLIVVLLDILFSLLMAFWFAAIARQCHLAELDAVKEEHAREREKIRVNAERQKSRIVNKSHKEILKETRRAYAMANFKVGASFAGILAIGGVMLYSQFVTFGLLVLTTGGGGLVGYLTRVRQERRARKKETVVLQTPEVTGSKAAKKLK